MSGAHPPDQVARILAARGVKSASVIAREEGVTTGVVAGIWYRALRAGLACAISGSVPGRLRLTHIGDGIVPEGWGHGRASKRHLMRQRPGFKLWRAARAEGGGA